VPLVVFTSGGNASGKSTMIPDGGPEHIVFDSTLSQVEPSAKRIDQALDADHHVELRHVSRDPVEAWRAVLDRAMEPGPQEGRTVTVLGHIDTHLGARRVELADCYAGNPRVTTVVYENTPDGLVSRSLDWLRSREYPTGDALQAELVRILDEARAADRITEPVYRGARGRLGAGGESAAGRRDVPPADRREEGPPAVAPPAGPPITPRSAPLPRELAGAKPRYNVGASVYQPAFANDVDLAAYILAQKRPSKRDADYLAYVQQETGLDADGARALGAQVREAVPGAVRTATPGTQEQPARVAVAPVWTRAVSDLPVTPNKPARVTPQVPNEPGTKYLLPSFATATAAKTPTKPANLDPARHHATQRGVAWEAMTEAELRELLEEGVGHARQGRR
jgi:hypothetical protein